MSSADERAALREKADEVHLAMRDLEEKLSKLPSGGESEALRDMLGGTLGQLRRVDAEMRDILGCIENQDKDTAEISEGGRTDG